jgi:hypothetical protein
MNRLALVGLIALAGTWGAATPQEILTKRYKEFNTDILKGDAKSMTAWLHRNCGSHFTYKSYQKAVFDRSTYISGVLQQIGQTSKVLKSTTTVRSFKKTGATIVATVASDFKGVVVFDSKRLILTDQSVTFETWAIERGEWKLQNTVQVNADTQMHPEGED